METPSLLQQENEKLRQLLEEQAKKLKAIDGQYRKELAIQGTEIKEKLKEQNRMQHDKTIGQLKPQLKSITKESNKKQYDKTIDQLKPQLKSATKEGNKKRKNCVIKGKENEGQHILMQKITGAALPWNSDTDDFFSDIDEAEEHAELVVEPDAEKEYATECEGTTGADPTEITSINNHRLYFNQQPEFLVTFDNGERIWSVRNNIVKDAKQLLSDYLNDNKLMDSDFAPRSMRIKKAKVKETVKQQSSTCKHSLWYEFEDEIHAKYCAPGFLYHGVGCGKCKSRFIATAKESTKCKFSSSEQLEHETTMIILILIDRDVRKSKKVSILV